MARNILLGSALLWIASSVIVIRASMAILASLLDYHFEPFSITKFHWSASWLRLVCVKICHSAAYVVTITFDAEVHRLASKGLMVICPVNFPFTLLLFTMHLLVILRSFLLLFAFLALSRRELYCCVVFFTKLLNLEWITLICIQLFVLLKLVERFKSLTFEW